MARMVEQKIGEDSLLGLWCTVTGRRIWNPLPTIIDHDTELPSTYGHENHAHRRPLVRWDNWNDDFLTQDERNAWLVKRAEVAPGKHESEVPHVGRFPGWCLPQLARQVVPGYSADDFRRHLADDGHETIVPLLYGTRRCWFCLADEVVAQSHVTTVGMCRRCLSQIAAKLIGG